MIEYKDTCLTFMDIQGFKQMVLETYADNPETIYGILKQFKAAQYIRPENYSFSWSPEIVSFSDSVVRAVSYVNTGATAEDVIANEISSLRKLQKQLFSWGTEADNSQGICLRGGTTDGASFVSVDDNMVFGSAMIRAFELEHVKDKPFRIVIDQVVVDAHQKLFNELAEGRIVAIDEDGQWFVDYFSVNEDELRGYDYAVELKRLQKVGNLLQSQVFNNAEDAVLLSKYTWAAERHNAAVMAIEVTDKLSDAMKIEGLKRGDLLVQLCS